MVTRRWDTSLATLVLAVLLVVSPACPLAACTLWAAQGSAVDGGGTLIAKNRDWKPDQIQKIRIIHPGQGLHPFLGLYAEGQDEPGCKAGVNDAGLVIVSATASSIPKAARVSEKGTENRIQSLLENCSTVDEVLTHAALFTGPRFLLVADPHKVADIEIAPGRRFAVRTMSDGTIAQTNYYQLDELSTVNVRVGKSSRLRLARIEGLLSGHAGFFDTADFLAMAADRHDGPDDSIFRTGSSPGAERTMATFVARIGARGGVELDVTLYNPDSLPEHRHWTSQELASSLSAP